jgi:excisionase family DNA binding protein
MLASEVSLMPQSLGAFPQHVSRSPRRRKRAPPRRSSTELFALPLEGDALVDTREACRALRIGRSTLWRWAKDGRIRPVRLGGTMTRWRISDLRAFLLAFGDDAA